METLYPATKGNGTSYILLDYSITTTFMRTLQEETFMLYNQRKEHFPLILTNTLLPTVLVYLLGSPAKFDG